MSYEKIETELKDSYILVPKRFGDDRGFYSSLYVSKELEELGITTTKNEQTAISKSKKGVVRGLHFQKDPWCQEKLVFCMNGKVVDVIVDLRKDSPTYKKWLKVELSFENGKMLYVPRGFAHGFISLEDNTVFGYFVDNHYNPAQEDGIAWNDPEINIDWELKKYGIEEPELSGKDKVRGTLKEVNPNFYMHKRYLVTGCKGQLGYDVVRELNKRGIYDILNLDVEEMNITDRKFVMFWNASCLQPPLK